MSNEGFKETLNALFEVAAPELNYNESGSGYGFISDDASNVIETIPILDHEERYLSYGDSESYVYLSIYSDGEYSEQVKIKSCNLFNSASFVSRFGNKPFALFNNVSWDIFFTTMKVMLLKIEQITSYQYAGWNKELDKYLLGSFSVDVGNVIPINSSLVKNKTVLSDKSSCDICENINNIFSKLFSNRIEGYICIIHLMLSHAKPRFVVLYRICPEFLVNIVGDTGSRKTSIANAVYNTCDVSASSFEDTLASIRRMFQANSSGVTIVDDYKISTANNDAKFEKIVRLSGDVQTTGKYVSGNKVVDELITGMAVITGEQRPQLQQSSYSRILFLDLNCSPVDLNYLTNLQESKADVNSFIVLFVKFILSNSNFDSEFIALFEAKRNEFLNDPSYSGMHGRYYAMYAWLACMWSVYKEIMLRNSVDVTYDFETEIKAFIKRQNDYYDNNPINLFITGYTELRNANEIDVIENAGINNLKFDVIDCTDTLFFKSNGVYQKICKFYQDKGMNFPCSERKLRQILYDAGILSNSNGKLTIERKTKDNRSYSGYYLFKSYFTIKEELT